MKDKKIPNLTYYILLAGLFLGNLLFIWSYADGLIDSDMSSEMLLGKILAEENAILSPNWFYSTELRVLNTQLVFSFFFRFFHDWTVIRVASSAVLYLIFLASYYYLLRQAGYDRRLFITSAIFLILPLSGEYFTFVLLGLYCIPHISISFVALGLLFQYARTNKKSSKVITVFFMIILSILAGMGGLRQIIILYLPIVLATLFWTFYYNRGKLCFLLNGIMCFVFSMIGYLINIRVLTHKYHFSKFTDIQWKNFSVSGLEFILDGFFTFFGFSEGGKVFSITTLINGFAFMMMIITIGCFYITINKQKNGGGDCLKTKAASTPYNQ